MRGVKGYNEPHFLFLANSISWFVGKINTTDKIDDNAINAVVDWRNEMVKKGFHIFFHLRSDTGTNFIAEAFRD